MTRNIEYAGRNFGDGHLIEDSAGGTTFYELIANGEWELLADYLGWSEGCPVVPKVIERGGAQAAAETYADLLLTRQIQMDIIRQYSPSLADQIMSPANRRPGEPPGEFIESSIPFDHADILRGPARLVGYNLPRLTREFIGPREKRTQGKIIKAFDIFERALKASIEFGHKPIQFMINLAEHYACAEYQVDYDGHNPKKYLRRLLGVGKIREDNLWVDAILTLTNAATMGTSLYYAYSHMTTEEKKKLGIVELTGWG